MKKLLLVLLTFFSTLVHSEVEVGVGVSSFTKNSNGFWYQDGFDHTLKMNYPNISIGGNWSVHPNLNVRLGYQYLGKVTSTALASASDENYAQWQQGKEKIWPLSRWNGSGDVQGLYLTLNPSYRYGPYVFQGEVGGWLYRPTWEVDIPDWIANPEDTPHHVYVSHKTRAQYSMIYGFGVSRDNWTLSYTYRQATASGDEYPAVYSGPVRTLELRHKF